MSEHAETIQDFQCELDRIGIEVGASAARTWMWQNRELVLAALDALLAENQRLREALTWISDPSYVGSYSDAEVVEIHRSWAREALAGDGE